LEKIVELGADENSKIYEWVRDDMIAKQGRRGTSK